MEDAVWNEEQMLIDNGFSISVGNIIESSISSSSSWSSSSSQYSPTGSENNAHAIINNPGASKKSSSSRRKKTRKNSQIQTLRSTNLTDDGCGWRKYGQKSIQKELHPKSYYRCTHHKEEKCEAKKWVQQESENPPIYKTTYLGRHTCNNPHKIPQIYYSDYSSSLSFTPENPSIMSSTPVLIHFDSPTPSPHVFNINGDHHEQQTMKACDTGLNTSSSPPSISSCSDDSMMFFDDQGSLEIDTYPSIPSPNCSYDSYELDLMIQELIGHDDNVDFMQEYWS